MQVDQAEMNIFWSEGGGGTGKSTAVEMIEKIADVIEEIEIVRVSEPLPYYMIKDEKIFELRLPDRIRENQVRNINSFEELLNTCESFKLDAEGFNWFNKEETSLGHLIRTDWISEDIKYQILMQGRVQFEKVRDLLKPDAIFVHDRSLVTTIAHQMRWKGRLLNEKSDEYVEAVELVSSGKIRKANLLFIFIPDNFEEQVAQTANDKTPGRTKDVYDADIAKVRSLLEKYNTFRSTDILNPFVEFPPLFITPDKDSGINRFSLVSLGMYLVIREISNENAFPKKVEFDIDQYKDCDEFAYILRRFNELEPEEILTFGDFEFSKDNGKLVLSIAKSFEG